MKRIALIYGMLSGGTIICLMIIGFALTDNAGSIGPQWLGYLVMVTCLSMIFVGVKRYRDKELGGVIKFWRAFGVGAAISGVATLIYVIAWEIYLATTDYQFIDAYIASAIDHKRASGLTGDALQQQIDQLTAMAENYGNPLFRIPVTMMELLPLALVISLISAAILRNPKVLPARG